MSDKAKGIAVAVAVVLLSVWVYRVYQKHMARDATLASVRDAGERLRKALSGSSDAPDFERDAAAVDAHVTALRKRDVTAIQPLADAADDYLVTAREILRREAAMKSAAEGLAKHLDALAQHIQRDRGRGDWTQLAVRLRAEVDREAREYRIAAESYAAIVESLPTSQTRVAPYVDPALLLDDESVKAARERALDALARTEENVRRIANLRRAG
ncbi:MAG TPA: hypothetical protein VED01_18750 [Burkholderiales bacterium]|nr:hypothetical protein [Burkholderiales bacterium]